MVRLFISVLMMLVSSAAIGKGTNIFGLGIYDIKFDGSSTKETLDFRFEQRLNKSLFNIGPKEDNFFFLKPFYGVEYTNDSASYFLTGIYLEDNIGELFEGKESNYYFTPSFGVGFYNDGSGKKLGNDIQFRTSFEVSFQLKNNNRVGISLSHISNANLGDKNPGVEILSLSYQVPY